MTNTGSPRSLHKMHMIQKMDSLHFNDINHQKWYAVLLLLLPVVWYQQQLTRKVLMWLLLLHNFVIVTCSSPLPLPLSTACWLANTILPHFHVVHCYCLSCIPHPKPLLLICHSQHHHSLVDIVVALPQLWCGVWVLLLLLLSAPLLAHHCSCRQWQQQKEDSRQWWATMTVTKKVDDKDGGWRWYSLHRCHCWCCCPPLPTIAIVDVAIPCHCHPPSAATMH